METKKLRGRPRLPEGDKKVMFAKRVHPSKVDALIKVVTADSERLRSMEAYWSIEPFKESNLKALEPRANEVLTKASPDVMTLLEQLEKKDSDISVLKNEVDEAMMMDLDEKGRLGWKLYYGLRDGKKKSEYDQTQ